MFVNYSFKELDKDIGMIRSGLREIEKVSCMPLACSLINHRKLKLNLTGSAFLSIFKKKDAQTCLFPRFFSPVIYASELHLHQML